MKRLCWIENNVCYIPLQNGSIAMCDEDRFEEVKKISWHQKEDGYVRGSENYKRKYLHRFLYPETLNLEIDHINGNKLDNRSCNLRICTRAQNTYNKKTKKKFKGITFDKDCKKWRAQIGLNHKQIYIGSFDTPEKAAIAYDKKALLIQGDFAKLNFNGVNL